MRSRGVFVMGFCLSRKVALIVFASSSLPLTLLCSIFSEQLALPNVYRTITSSPFKVPTFQSYL